MGATISEADGVAADLAMLPVALRELRNLAAAPQHGARPAV